MQSSLFCSTSGCSKNMTEYLKNCWEIRNCELHKNGRLTLIFGECVASLENMGHSCWMLAGTFCDGQIQGTAAQKEKKCRNCNVYQQYHRAEGQRGDQVRRNFPEEEIKYYQLQLKRRLERDSVINLRGPLPVRTCMTNCSFENKVSAW